MFGRLGGGNVTDGGVLSVVGRVLGEVSGSVLRSVVGSVVVSVVGCVISVATVPCFSSMLG